MSEHAQQMQAELRIANASGESCHELCARIAAVTGDRIATVDLIIWRAASLGWV